MILTPRSALALRSRADGCVFWYPSRREEGQGSSWSSNPKECCSFLPFLPPMTLGKIWMSFIKGHSTGPVLRLTPGSLMEGSSRYTLTHLDPRWVACSGVGFRMNVAERSQRSAGSGGGSEKVRSWWKISVWLWEESWRQNHRLGEKTERWIGLKLN